MNEWLIFFHVRSLNVAEEIDFCPGAMNVCMFYFELRGNNGA